MNAAHSCTHGIENGVVGTAKFAKTKVPWAFVESKSDVHFGNNACQVDGVNSSESDCFMSLSVESEVFANKRKRLSCPNAGVSSARDSIVPNASFEARLGVFRDARAGE